MTRKDYIAIADAFKATRREVTRRNVWLIDYLAERVGGLISADNPSFDREHFLAVVRGERDLNSRPPRKKVAR